VLSPAVTSISAAMSRPTPTASMWRGATVLVSIFRCRLWTLTSSCRWGQRRAGTPGHGSSRRRGREPTA
jgi:hypothetical protein